MANSQRGEDGKFVKAEVTETPVEIKVSKKNSEKAKRGTLDKV
tara:strand:+ start:576 stop:704 length:129 start_codon:yes stop_codon:yes gene_type:complete